MRHSGGQLVWSGTSQNQTTAVLDDNGARYTIDRLGQSWMISFLPFGSAERGREAVPWLPGKKSLTTAKQAAEEHHSRQE